MEHVETKRKATWRNLSGDVRRLVGRRGPHRKAVRLRGCGYQVGEKHSVNISAHPVLESRFRVFYWTMRTRGGFTCRAFQYRAHAEQFAIALDDAVLGSADVPSAEIFRSGGARRFAEANPDAYPRLLEFLNRTRGRPVSAFTPPGLEDWEEPELAEE